MQLKGGFEMFKIKLHKDNRCKKHLCQDKAHPSIYRCSETLAVKIQSNPVLTDRLIKKHSNHKWLEDV